MFNSLSSILTVMFLSLLTFSTPALSSLTDYDLCVEEAFYEHEEANIQARQTWQKESANCSKFPMDDRGEKYEKCLYQAELKYNEAKQAAQTILNLKKRACIKLYL